MATCEKCGALNIEECQAVHCGQMKLLVEIAALKAAIAAHRGIFGHLNQCKDQIGAIRCKHHGVIQSVEQYRKSDAGREILEALEFISPEKFEALANWIDVKCPEDRWSGNDEVQRDLRALAQKIRKALGRE